MLTHDERDPEHLQVGSDVEEILRYEAVKVAADSLDTQHGTGAPDVRLHPRGLDRQQAE